MAQFTQSWGEPTVLRRGASKDHTSTSRIGIDEIRINGNRKISKENSSHRNMAYLSSGYNRKWAFEGTYHVEIK